MPIQVATSCKALAEQLAPLLLTSQVSDALWPRLLLECCCASYLDYLMWAVSRAISCHQSHPVAFQHVRWWYSSTHSVGRGPDHKEVEMVVLSCVNKPAVWVDGTCMCLQVATCLRDLVLNHSSSFPRTCPCLLQELSLAARQSFAMPCRYSVLLACLNTLSRYSCACSHLRDV